MKKQNIFELKTKGYTILRKWVSNEWLKKINEALPELFEEHKKIRQNNNNGITSDGVAMNVLVSNDIFIDFLQEMINKGLLLGPEKAQTGPAVRQDINTIEEHMAAIEDPSLREIYRTISQDIIDHYS